MDLFFKRLHTFGALYIPKGKRTKSGAGKEFGCDMLETLRERGLEFSSHMPAAAKRCLCPKQRDLPAVPGSPEMVIFRTGNRETRKQGRLTAFAHYPRQKLCLWNRGRAAARWTISAESRMILAPEWNVIH